MHIIFQRAFDHLMEIFPDISSIDDDFKVIKLRTCAIKRSSKNIEQIKLTLLCEVVEAKCPLQHTRRGGGVVVGKLMIGQSHTIRRG